MIIVECPHCQCQIEIDQVNCAIFRHGAYIHNNEQIPPHSSKAECDRLVHQGQAIGCCKPFRLVKEGEKWIAVACNYI